jgi:agmatinase
MTTRAPSFLHLSGEGHTYAQAQTVILPISYERTTSYRKGTAQGPEALLRASEQLEFYEYETRTMPCETGIFTHPILGFADSEPIESCLDRIYRAAMPLYASGKFVVGIGGEHAVTIPLVKAFSEALSEPFGIVGVDAHFDLRDSYEGTPLSHACIMRRCREMTRHTLSLGIRAFSAEEAAFSSQDHVAFVTDRELWERDYQVADMLKKLPDKVYLTIDIDFFSPAEFPGTGTPVPGGPSWWEGLSVIQQVFQAKHVIAMDIMELMPQPQDSRSDFAAAHLLYKCLAYRQIQKTESP